MEIARNYNETSLLKQIIELPYQLFLLLTLILARFNSLEGCSARKLFFGIL